MIEGPTHIPLAVVGCDFRIASSRIRSQVLLDEQQAGRINRMLRKDRIADGFVDLNTCNRIEWLVSSRDPNWASELLRTQMIERVDPEFRSWFSPYVYTGAEAARHVLRVAIGQESLVVGERQIAGQVYRALEVARKRGSSSRILNGLGTVAGRLVRIALRRNCIGNAAVGVHSLALGYLAHQTHQRSIKVALVGLGRIGRRIMGFVQENPRIEAIFCNRTVPAGKHERVYPLDDLRFVLDQVDAVLICTGAPFPIVLAQHLKARADRPLLLIDIGIPEQVDRRSLPAGNTLAGLDELTRFYRQQTFPVGGQNNQEEIESLLVKAQDEFLVYCNESTFTDILNTVQKHHSQLVHEEIPRMIEKRLSYLNRDACDCLEQDLRAIVLEYTSEVFRTIKEASMRMAGFESSTEKESD
jgi:glutamyl-tRNA reductase